MCYPFKHKEFVGINVTVSIVATYIFGFVGNCLAFFQVKFQVLKEMLLLICERKYEGAVKLG